MPVYTYRCPSCGDFDALVPSSSCRDDQACIQCCTPSPRVITATHLATLSQSRRHAHETNERSQHAPSCRCCSGHQNSPSSPDRSGASETPPIRTTRPKRPWMLGH
ncbi:zinc ribbon domain-containing protein [Aquisalimonas asiatica]|uniref:zinc ribbon domain-containing protein n=1 Tax=Aquisalimonas asiatica TaxID=406100 RepID=UPI000B86C92A